MKNRVKVVYNYVQVFAILYVWYAGIYLADVLAKKGDVILGVMGIVLGVVHILSFRESKK